MHFNMLRTDWGVLHPLLLIEDRISANFSMYSRTQNPFHPRKLGTSEVAMKKKLFPIDSLEACTLHLESGLIFLCKEQTPSPVTVTLIKMIDNENPHKIGNDEK